MEGQWQMVRPGGLLVSAIGILLLVSIDKRLI
jgi:hypothetical protein